MQELYIGMPLLNVMELIETINIQENFKNNILNLCKQELEYGDSKITNEIELSMLKSWINNSDKIKMPELSDNYELVDVFTEQKKEKTRVYEKYASKDGTYYTKCITKNADNVVIQVSISYKNSSFIDIVKNGGTEDYIFDADDDGYANSRTIIKTKDSVDIINDFNLDGKED